MQFPRQPLASGTLDNPLEPVAWLLFQIRTVLDDAPDGRAPVWVRLARGRRIRDKGLGPALVKAMELVFEFVSFLHELFLDLEELLVTIDPNKALWELALKAAQAATAPELGNALATLFDSPDLATKMADARSALDDVERYVNFVPEPSDVRIIGAQVFALLCIDVREPRPSQGPFVFADGTGRMRLLQWAFERKVLVRGYGTWDNPESRSVEVERLGVRPLWFEAGDAQPTLAQDQFSLSRQNAPPIELYRYSFEGERASADLHELHAILEALGYTTPEIPADERDKFSGALAARLEIFQALNDLPRSGELDPHTLHRLLHLDWASGNIARARPFDPRRFRRIPLPIEPKKRKIKITVTREEPWYVPVPGEPKRSGKLELVNPDADHPEDEKIEVEEGEALVKKRKPTKKGTGQTKPMAWYPCGVTPSETGEIKLKADRGWIQHKDEMSLVEPKGPLLGQFVALESRPKIKGVDLHEGGVISEGVAHRGGRFFFSARETEPWVAGRHGVPDTNNRIHPSPDGKALQGRVSGMYQWVDLGPVLENAPAGHRLLLQGRCAQRSLCKEGGGVDGMPDAGQMVIALATRSWWSTAKYATRYDPKRLVGYAWSCWWPNDVQYSGLSRARSLALDMDWRVRRTQILPMFPGGADPVVALMVGLYGKHARNYDIDAYFDSVEVWWEWSPWSQAPAQEVQSGQQ